MICKPIRRMESLAWAISSIIVLIIAYAFLSNHQHQINPKDTTIPNFSQLLEGGKLLIVPDANGDIWLWNDICATYSRHSLGLALGTFIAVVLGIWMGCYHRAEAFFLPALNFFAKIPPTALMAVYFVLFGTETLMFVAMIALGVFPILAQTIYQSVRKDVADVAISKAYTLGGSSGEVIVEVIFQQILPRVIEAVRLQIGPALIFLIAAEWMVADVGFGYRLRIQSRLLNMNVVYFYIVIIGATTFVADYLLTKIRERMCPWF